MTRDISRNSKTRASLIAGDVVSIQAEDSKFAVMKILVTDEAGVYGLLYAQLFAERPRIVNIHGLEIAPFGTIHFAITHDRFAQFHPEVITHRQVTEKELMDYPFGAIKTSDSHHGAGGEWLGRLEVH
jgi:hypothetical protein